MKRKMTLIMAMVMLLSLALCACSDSDVESTTAPQTTATPTQAPTSEPTQAPTSEPTQAPTSEPTQAPTTQPPTTAEQTVQSVYIPGMVNLPVPDSIGSAEFSDGGFLDDGSLAILYSNADQEALELYLRLCGYCGLYGFQMQDNDTQTLYLMLQPGFNYLCFVQYMHESGELFIQSDPDANTLFSDGIDGVLSYFMEDFSVPGATTTNILPQFYASVGSLPFLQNQIGSLSYAFDGAMCWTEFYSDVDSAKLQKYLSDVQFCGFDVRISQYDIENSVFETLLFHVTNGDLEVIIVYSVADGSATVHYEPGVSMHLISGDEYAMCIPGR